MDRAISIVLTALVLALGAKAAMQRVELRNARAQTSPLAQADDSVPAAAPAATPAPKISAALSPAPVEPGTEVKIAAPRKTARDYYRDVVARMRHGSAIRKSAAAKALSVVNEDYAVLIKHLQLDPAVADTLIRLLQAKRQVRSDLYEKLYHASYTDAEQAVLMREAERKRNELEREIAGLLGDEVYAVYKEYSDTLPQRRELEPFKTKLYGAGLDLSWDQENALLVMMQEESRKLVAPDEDPVLALVGTLLPEERAASEQELALRRTQVNNERYYDAAKAILTPEQLKIFREHLDEEQSSDEFYVDAFPRTEPESNDRAKVAVGSPTTVLQQPVSVSAVASENVLWGDNVAGSKAEVFPTEGNMLGLQTDLGSGWGAGITFWPTAAAMNPDLSVNAAGATKITAKIKAPAGVKLRFGLLESGAEWSGSEEFSGSNGADGEAFRHEGVTTADGWQVYTIPLSELKLNGGWGNQKGNRTIDTQAIKGLEIFVPGGQPDAAMEIDWVRVE